MISIITPYFNSARFLPETIDSVLAQTCVDWEWLLVDDGSSDGSAEVVREAARLEPRIRPLRHETNQGQAAARNLALRHASGGIIAFLDSDDLWTPGKLASDVAVFDRHPAAVVTWSRLVLWTDATRPPAAEYPNLAPALGQPDGTLLEPPVLLEHVIANLYDFRWQYPAPSCLAIRREALPLEGDLFDPALRFYEDLAPLVYLLSRHPAVLSDEITTWHRRHADSFSASTGALAHEPAFQDIADWLRRKTLVEPPQTSEAILHALELAYRRRARFRRREHALEFGRKVLPKGLRDWLWKRFGDLV